MRKWFWPSGILLSIWIIFSVIPGHAASFVFHSINSVSGNCSTKLTIETHWEVTATTNDLFGDDYFGVVVTDANNQAIGFASFSLAVGLTDNSVFTIYIYFDSPGFVPTLPLTISAYDTNVIGASSSADVQAGTFLDSVGFDPRALGGCLPPSTNTTNQTINAPFFKDNRINNGDKGNPIVVYGHDFETGRGLLVYSTTGDILLNVSAETLAAIPDCPETNTLIASDNDVFLYRLDSCLYQINTRTLDGAKTYVLIFNSLETTATYRSYEEQ